MSSEVMTGGAEDYARLYVLHVTVKLFFFCFFVFPPVTFFGLVSKIGLLVFVPVVSVVTRRYSVDTEVLYACTPDGILCFRLLPLMITHETYCLFWYLRACVILA